jgi:hypothetical protein
MTQSKNLGKHGWTARSHALAVLLAATFVVFGANVTSAADDPDPVLGQWTSGDSAIEITESNGKLTGKVIAILRPVYEEGEELGPPGAARTDQRNPDPALKVPADPWHGIVDRLPNQGRQVERQDLRSQFRQHLLVDHAG